MLSAPELPSSTATNSASSTFSGSDFRSCCSRLLYPLHGCSYATSPWAGTSETAAPDNVQQRKPCARRARIASFLLLTWPGDWHFRKRLHKLDFRARQASWMLGLSLASFLGCCVFFCMFSVRWRERCAWILATHLSSQVFSVTCVCLNSITNIIFVTCSDMLLSISTMCLWIAKARRTMTIRKKVQSNKIWLLQFPERSFICRCNSSCCR